MTRPRPIIYVDAHPIGIAGVWRIRVGKRYAATLVQPNAVAGFRVRPTVNEVRQAIRDIAPTLAEADLPVQYLSDAEGDAL